MTKLTILQLYPNELNVYGDNGNLICLTKRLQWREIDYRVIKHNVGDTLTTKPDIILGGGGQDSNQVKIADDFALITPKLKKWVEADVPTLLICGAYQLFGEYFKTEAGERIAGADILPIYTKADKQRSIGNVVISSPKFGRIVGYENHSGQTFLEEDLQPLGTVIVGDGNNRRDNHEGVFYHNLIGTYCHGPILPKNPRLADFLISQALKNRGENGRLRPLDDSLELQAAEQAAHRPR